MTLLNELFVTLIMTLASALQGSIGYGMALVANPVLVLVDPAFVPGPMLFCTFLLSFLIAARERRALDLSGLGWALGGRVFGAAIGAWILLRLSQEGLTVFFGVLVLVAVAITALGLRIPVNPRNLFVAGLLAGVMGTVASIGGPPMALVYQRSSGAKLRSTLAGFFIVGTLISMTTLALIGRFGLHEIFLGLLLFPGALLGYFISSPLLARLQPALLRALVLSVAGLSAVVVISRVLL